MLAGYTDQLLMGIEDKQLNAKFISMLRTWCWGKLGLHHRSSGLLSMGSCIERINVPGALQDLDSNWRSQAEQLWKTLPSPRGEPLSLFAKNNQTVAQKKWPTLIAFPSGLKLISHLQGTSPIRQQTHLQRRNLY